MLRREKRQSEKEAETVAARKKEPLDQSPDIITGIDPLLSVGKCITGCSSPQSPAAYNEGEADDDLEKRIMLPSPLKAQIDLNIQPEREEEPSPMADVGSTARSFADATG